MRKERQQSIEWSLKIAARPKFMIKAGDQLLSRQGARRNNL